MEIIIAMLLAVVLTVWVVRMFTKSTSGDLAHKLSENVQVRVSSNTVDLLADTKANLDEKDLELKDLNDFKKELL